VVAVDDSVELAKLKRRLQTVESRLQDLVETLSAYQSGTEKNPNTGVYVSDSKTGATAKLDYDADADAVRVTKVRQ
jgi:hypothetical protein